MAQGIAGALAAGIGDPMRLRDHPQFRQVFAAFCDGLVAPLRGQRLMIKLFGQRAPTEIAAQIVMMHLSARSSAERPTLTRLQQRLPAPRQVAAFVALLRGLSLVAAERDPLDGRMRYLVPGHVILDGLRDWFSLHLACHARLWPPSAAHHDRLSQDVAFFHETVRQCAPWLDRANRPLSGFADLAWTDEHDSGLYLALVLVERQCHAPGGAIAISTPQLAGALGVSRSHIRNLLNLMEARGIASFDAARQRLTLGAPFIDTVESWFCHQVCWMAGAASRADAALAEARVMRPARPPDQADFRSG